MLKSILLLSLAICSVHAAVWKILVGAEGDIDPTWGVSEVQFFHFYPNTLTVNVGDSVVFQWGSPMAYTVTFASAAPSLVFVDPTGQYYFNPAIAFSSASNVVSSTSNIVTSGIMFWEGAGYPSWTANFTTVGTFPFYSVFYNAMTGSITVQPAGSAYPTDQATIDAQAQAKIAIHKQVWPQSKIYYKLDRTVPFSKPHPNGVNTIWYVWNGYGDFYNRIGVNKFFPESLTVKVGDTIVFNNADIGSHTLGINSTTEFANDVDFDPVSGRLQLAKIWTTITTEPNTGGWSCGGLMLPPIVPGGTTYTWNVTMNAPGNYHMVCSLHRFMGMIGTITVTN